LLLFVLLRTRRNDKGGVDQHAYSQHETACGQDGFDGGGEALPQLVRLKQVAEVQQRDGASGTRLRARPIQAKPRGTRQS
jgi:hypothetical protein